MKKTVENIKTAYISKLNTSARYAALADIEMQAGKKDLAKLFKSAAKSDKIHASHLSRLLTGMGEKVPDFTPTFEVGGDSTEHVEKSLENEIARIKQRYPQLLKDADEEVMQAKNIQTVLNGMYKNDQTKTGHLRKALDALKKKDETLLSKKFWVCPMCGHVMDNIDNIDVCPICGMPKEKFTEVQ